jgi:hypothetical protein
MEHISIRLRQIELRLQAQHNPNWKRLFMARLRSFTAQKAQEIRKLWQVFAKRPPKNGAVRLNPYNPIFWS